MINTEIRLEAETINNSNNWISGAGNGIIRKTGESGNYRIFYSFSSTTFGTFDNVDITVTLTDAYDNIESFFNIGIPAGVSYTTDYSGTQKTLTIHLGSGIAAGQSGFITFSILSKKNRGPNAYRITANATITGEFVDGNTHISEPFSLSEDGPYWEVEAINPHSYTKKVTANSSLYTPDARAYIVEYIIEDSVTVPEDEQIGAWGYTSAYTVDTLPTIGGVDPIVLYSNITPYTVTGNQVRWEQKPPNNVYQVGIGYNLVLRVQYPKSAVDAIGGIGALGEITNTVDVHFDLIGGTHEVKSAQATHRLRAIPAPVQGELYTLKRASLYSDENPFPGVGLYENSGKIRLSIRAGMTGSNVMIDEQLITDYGLSYTLEGGEIVPLTGDDYQWESIVITNLGVTAQLEYATNLDPSFRLGPIITNEYTDFPIMPSGEYITVWRLRVTNNFYPNTLLSITSILQLKQRPADAPLIESLNNTALNETYFADGTELRGSSTVNVPFTNQKNIFWEMPALTLNNSGIQLGSTFQVSFNLLILEETGVNVLGTNLYMLISDEFSFVEEGSHPATATPNWNGTGKTLVHARVTNFSRALTRVPNTRVYNFRAGPSAPLNEYKLEAYYVTNAQQANDDSIFLRPVGATAPDIYDFDENGDTAQLVPYRSVNITLTPVNIVNVLKMSKALNDSDFQINNNTQITSGEIFNYKLFVRNDSTQGMTYVTMIDVFPFVGDRFGSTWAPALLNVPQVPSNVTTSYSYSTDPKMEPIQQSGQGDWFTTAPEDLSLVKAIKFDFGGKEYEPGESAEIFLEMMAPNQAPDLSRAYNSVNYIASAIASDGTVTQYLPAFSPPAYAQLTFREFENFVGDYVWQDLNANGIIDPDEPGLNGIPVKLLDTDGNLVYETLTHNHPVTGQPGYYAFSGIWPGRYVASFPISLEDGSVLTTQRVSSDPAINSVPDVETGLSDPFSVEEGSVVDDIDAGYVYVYIPEGTIGDFVWDDLNGNGIQDPGEPGINGVSVGLYSASGILLSTEYTANHPISGEPGYYEFTGLSAGEYRIFFELVLGDGRVLTLQNQGSDPNRNSKPDPVTGFTPLINLIENTTISNIDAGYVAPPIEIGKIGDFVWYDANANGIQDLNEPGINAVEVLLVDESGTIVERTLTANHPTSGAPGYYEFLAVAPGGYDVPPGRYKVVFPTQVPVGRVLTTPNVGANPNINSKPNQSTGETDYFDIALGQQILNLDAGYVLPQIPGARIGNFVWVDLNGNGIQDPGEPGLNGVMVMLLNEAGEIIAEAVTGNTSDGIPGYYYFDDVLPGNYSVKFPTVLFSGYTLTIPNAGSDPNLDSRPDQQTGITPVFSVAAGENNFTIDAGYVVPPALADLGVVKTVDAQSAHPGDVLTYTLTITNYGPDTAQAAMLTDHVVLSNLSNLEYSLDEGLHWYPWTGTLALGNMAMGASIVMLGRGTVITQPGSVVVNVAVVSSETADPNPDNNTDTENVPVIQGETLADLGVVKTVDKESAYPGDVLTYTLSITNYGPDTAQAATLTDVVVLSSLSSPQYSLDNGQTWNPWTGTLALGDMPLGSQIIVLGRGTVLAQPGSTVVNVAVVSSETTDPNPDNNTDTENVPVLPQEGIADIGVTKTVDPESSYPGEMLTYTITVHNFGPDTAHGVELSDHSMLTNLTQPQYSWDGGQSWREWTGTLSLGSMVLDTSYVILLRGLLAQDASGTITNTASVQSETPDPNPNNNEDSASVCVMAHCNVCCCCPCNCCCYCCYCCE